MNLLMVGGDTKGAWQMRGIQLGQALGARVTAEPTAADWAWADRVVLVKRAAMMWAAEARQCRVPVAWDALDFWRQPDDNGLTRDVLTGQVARIAAAAGVTHLIGATEAMAQDIGGSYLSHHCRIGLSPTPPRAKAQVVAYEGTQKYLGVWLNELRRACQSLGLLFVLNPPDVRQADVLVSFRHGQHNGWVCRQWKSGIKHVNAIVAGRPMVSQPSAARSELQPVGRVVSEASELVEALRDAASTATREQAYEAGLARAKDFQIDTIAARYRSVLHNEPVAA